MRPEHERRVATTAPGANVAVTQRGYVPVEPPPPTFISEDVSRLNAEQTRLAKEARASLDEIGALIREGNREVIDAIAAPVRPVYDPQGKLIEARRIIERGG